MVPRPVILLLILLLFGKIWGGPASQTAANDEGGKKNETLATLNGTSTSKAEKSEGNETDSQQCTAGSSDEDATEDIELPIIDHPKYEEEFFSLLNELNVDDWDVTLQQDQEMNYHLLFERDEILKTFPLPEMYNNLSEEEIIKLAVDYFDQQDEEWEEQALQNDQNPSKRPRAAKSRRLREAKILSMVYEKIGGSSILKTDGRWLSNESVCRWYGVVCGHRGQHKAGMKGRNPTPPPDDAVTAIQLNNLDLDGTLPTEFAMLEHLSQLILRNNKIRGTIPAQLAYTSRLCVLDLSNNRLTGSIPALLSTKTRFMYQIHLNRNHLKGPLPRNMRAWKKLWLMDVSQNGFSGTIPRQLAQMEDLAILSMGDNLFSGTLTPSLFEVTTLQMLDLGTNLLEGTIPYDIMNFERLHDLNLADNSLSGTFPSEILSLPELHTLIISHNKFEGMLPSEWVSDSKVGLIHAGHNKLHGTIPRSLMVAMQSNLGSLELSYNQIHGTMHTEIGLMTALHTIDVMGNKIEGTLPTEMLRMNPNLRLNFTDNLITGTIPGMFCGEGAPTNNILYQQFGCDAVLCRPGTFNAHGHATLHSSCRVCSSATPEEEKILGRVSCEGQHYVHGDLDGDGIVSPREILRIIYIDNIGKWWGSAYQTWADISIHECDLTGVTCSGRRMTKIDLSNANLCSSHDRQPGPIKFCLGIPSEIGLLSDLEAFQASRRQYLRGTIPTEFGKLSKLRLLDLSSCPSMHGTIPSELGALSSLRYLYLSHNPFRGSIPSTIFGLTNLEKLHLTKNRLDGTLPSILRTTNLKELMISRNDIGGSLPSQIGRLVALENFEGYGNDLTGTLPTELGKCSSLKRIDVFNNKLNGTLPTELALMNRLQIFHVKENELTGTIPSAIGDLPALSWFDVSDNRIFGTVPKTFATSRTLKDFRIADNMIHDPLPQGLCENKNMNTGATQHSGCAGVACPLGTYANLGFANEQDVGCRKCPGNESTLYLGSTKCRIFTTYDILSMYYDVMGGSLAWPREYWSSWQNKSVPICQWYGIRCDEQGEIVNIIFPFSENHYMFG